MSTEGEQMASAARALVRSTLSAEMVVRLGHALELTDALTDLVAIVVAAGDQADTLPAQQVADATPAGRRLAEVARTRLQTIAEEWEATASATFDAQPFDDVALASLTPDQAMADPFGAVASLIDVNGIADSLLPGLYDVGLGSTDEVFYLHAYLRARRRLRRTPLLLRTLFLTAVSTLEPLATRMVQLLLHHTERSTYPTLADPRLDAKARELCFGGGPGRYRVVLRDRFGIAKIDYVAGWRALAQIWQDRNALIHRAGVVDARHNAASGRPVGSVLALEPDQVRDAIDRVAAARYSLVIAAWDRIEPGVGTRLAQDMATLTCESLRSGRWRQAEGLSRVQLAFAGSAEAAAEAQVNHWLALEEGSGFKSIQHEVRAWDASALPPVFGLAQLILLRHDEQALQQMSTLLTAGDITPKDLQDWPLFDRLRATGALESIAG